MQLPAEARRLKIFRCLIGAAVILSAIQRVAVAGEGCWSCWYHGPASCCPHCPDDYCSKPLACPPCAVCCHGPDDYCCKPLPCVTPVCCFGCNDYACKPLPTICPCYLPPGSTCGPQPACISSNPCAH